MNNSLKTALLLTCRRLLRPVAGLAIKSGITWKEFAEVAKTAFVEVATKDHGIRGRPTNQVRVAILTGINRREVARQRAMLAGGEIPEPEYMNSAQRILSAWHQDSRYAIGGMPREIAVDGAAPSFADLCARYGGDMPVSALLKELKSLGAVQAVGEQGLRCMSRVYIPLQIEPDSALRAGGVWEDLGKTLVFNLTCQMDEPRRLERRAENDAIDRKHLTAFRAMLEREGQGFLERVDDWLTEHQARGNASERVRVGVGVYQIQDRIQSMAPQGKRI